MKKGSGEHENQHQKLDVQFIAECTTHMGLGIGRNEKTRTHHGCTTRTLYDLVDTHSVVYIHSIEHDTSIYNIVLLNTVESVVRCAENT